MSQVIINIKQNMNRSTLSTTPLEQVRTEATKEQIQERLLVVKGEIKRIVVFGIAKQSEIGYLIDNHANKYSDTATITKELKQHLKHSRSLQTSKLLRSCT